MLVKSAAALLIAALSGAAQAKTLVYCSEGSPENFNPMINTTGTSFDATRNVVDGLVKFKLGTTDLEPGLAESWEVAPDGLTYTFHLRHDVKWQSSARFKPTRDFGADDVLFSFARQWKEDNPFHKVSGGGYDYFSDMSFPKLLSAIDKVDDYTVRFVLTAPNAPFLSDLAMDFASIQSSEYADAMLKAGRPEIIDQEPIGTGPFQFVAYQRDSTIRYKRFSDTWGPKAKLDALVYSINKDPAVRLAKLRANECQVAAYPNLADLASIRADAELKVPELPGLNIGFMGLNTQRKPFDDKRVRLALNMAIDKKAILEAVYQGAGTPAKNLIPPTIWSWNDAVKDFPFDPAAAKRLLAEAGYADGVDIDLWAMPVQRPYNPDARRVAELMQSDLAKVGIRAKIVSYEWGEYRKRAQQGEGQAVQLGWTGDNGDPDNFFTVQASCAAARPGGNNIPKWCDKAFDDLIDKARELSDREARAELYRQAQALMHEEAPFFLIAHSVVFLPMRQNVEGYVMDPLGGHHFGGVDLR